MKTLVKYLFCSLAVVCVTACDDDLELLFFQTQREAESIADKCNGLIVGTTLQYSIEAALNFESDCTDTLHERTPYFRHSVIYPLQGNNRWLLSLQKNSAVATLQTNGLSIREVGAEWRWTWPTHFVEFKSSRYPSYYQRLQGDSVTYTVTCIGVNTWRITAPDADTITSLDLTVHTRDSVWSLNDTYVTMEGQGFYRMCNMDKNFLLRFNISQTLERGKDFWDQGLLVMRVVYNWRVMHYVQLLFDQYSETVIYNSYKWDIVDPRCPPTIGNPSY